MASSGTARTGRHGSSPKKISQPDGYRHPGGLERPPGVDRHSPCHGRREGVPDRRKQEGKRAAGLPPAPDRGDGHPGAGRKRTGRDHRKTLYREVKKIVTAMKSRRNYLLTGHFKKSKPSAKMNRDGRIMTFAYKIQRSGQQ